MAELREYPNLQNLSLKGNSLTRVGKDLGSIKKLKSIDLTENPFESVEDVLEALMGLPVLRNVKFDFISKEDESLLLQALPRLHSLNGVQLSGKAPAKTSKYL